MNTVMNILILIISILLILVVMFQSSKDDINDAFSGSKSELFKNQKTRGAELFLMRLTAVLAVAFITLVIIERMQGI